MKVTVNEMKEIEYPWLGIHQDGRVVLFSGVGIGTLIYYPYEFNAKTYNTGFHNSNWFMGDFKEFKGTITLEN